MMLFSCSVEVDEAVEDVSLQFDISPLASLRLPRSMQSGNTYTFELGYYPQSDCHVFDSFYCQNDNDEQSDCFTSDGQKTIGIIERSSPNIMCEDSGENTIVVKTLNIPVTSGNILEFRFFVERIDAIVFYDDPFAETPGTDGNGGEPTPPVDPETIEGGGFLTVEIPVN